MKGMASDPGYWEAFARDLGWEPDKVREAGEVGSLAVARGMSADEAIDVVLARVRDGKDVRVGPGLWRRLTRNEGLPALVGGVLLFLTVAVGRTGQSVATTWTIMWTALLALELFFIVAGLTRKAWRLSLLGLAMSVAALVVLLAPQPLR